VFTTGEQYANFPNFRYYQPVANKWTLPWARWLTALEKTSPGKPIEDPQSYAMLADKKDLLIVKELEKSARTKFAHLAPMLGISLQGVKYRYDKRLVPNGIVRNFAFDVYPYPIEVSAYHEIMHEFTSNQAMKKFISLLGDLFFVLGPSKILRRNALLLRTCILESQLMNMFTFFSEMAKAGILESYSSVRLNFAGRQTQTVSYELFDDERGWVFDLKRCLSEVRRSAKSKSLIASRSAYRH